MGSSPKTVVDTNVLLNLATPVVDGRTQAPTGSDPLKSLLTACDVHVPSTVIGEIADAQQDNDLLAAAATAVMRASRHLTTHNVESVIDESLEYGLDEGESHAIWLANDIDADLFVTDEFGTSNVLLVSLELDDERILSTTPQVLCVLADRDVLSPGYVDATLTYLCELKHWDRQYVERLREKYLG
jgi:rRNA-processing protein FCF1